MRHPDPALFEAAKKRFFELKAEWESLGFWQRIWRAREFQAKFDVNLQVAKLHDPRPKKSD